MKKFLGIIDQLQIRVDQHTRANRVLSEKVNSNDLKIIEQNAIISSKSEEFTKLLQEVQSLEAQLHQTTENNKNNILEQRQQLTKLSECKECM